MKKPFLIASRGVILLLFPFLPFSETSFPICGIPVYLPEIVILTALFLFLLAMSRKESGFRGVPCHVSVGFLFIFFGFLLSSAVSGSGISREELGALKSWVVFPALGCFLVSNLLVRERDARTAFLFWFLGTATVAFATLVPGVWSSETYDGRLVSFFRSPNHLAFFLLPGSVIGWYFLSRSNDIFRHILVFFAEGAVLLALFRTESAGAIAVSVFVTLLFFLSVFFGRRIMIVMFSSLAVVFVAGFAFLHVSGRWAEYSSGQVRNSFASRVMIWNVTADILSDTPVFGIGPRNFQDEYLSRQENYPPYLEWAVPHPHNIFLSFWISGGISALAGLIVLGIFVIRSIVVFSDIENHDRKVLAVMMSSIIPIPFLIGIFDDSYSGVGPANVFFLSVAGAVLLFRMKNPGKPRGIFQSSFIEAESGIAGHPDGS